MSRKLKKISASIPQDLLELACRVLDCNQTEALVAGLNELIAQQHRRKLVDLRGNLDITLDLDKFRQRARL